MLKNKAGILFISHSSDYSGASKCILEIAFSLDPNAFSVFMVVPGEGDLLNKARQRNLKVTVIPRIDKSIRDELSRNIFLAFRVFFSRLIYMIRLGIYVRQSKANIVHVNTSEEVYGALVAWICRKKIVWHIHEYFYRRTYREKYKFYLVNKLSQMIVCVSQAVASQFPSGSPKLKVIYNGETAKKMNIEQTCTQEVNSHPFTFSVVGGIQPIKGQLDAIHAFKELLRKKVGNIKLLIVGRSTDNTYCELCKKTVLKDPDLERCVQFIDYTEDVESIYQRTNVVLCPFSRDSFPYVALEALSYGKPIIGYKALGLEEIIQDKNNGLLVPMGDIEELAEACRFLISSSADLDRMCREALASSKRFDFSMFISHFEDLYKECLKN